MKSRVRLGIFPTATTPPQVFTTRRFETLLPHAWTLGCNVCLALQLYLPFICTQMWDHPVLQPPPCCASSPPQLPLSAPHTSLDECFSFNSLVVGLPYNSVLWQFWLFFVFKFVVVLLLVVQGGTMYLPTPPSWPEA